MTSSYFWTWYYHTSGPDNFTVLDMAREFQTLCYCEMKLLSVASTINNFWRCQQRWNYLNIDTKRKKYFTGPKYTKKIWALYTNLFLPRIPPQFGAFLQNMIHRCYINDTCYHFKSMDVSRRHLLVAPLWRLFTRQENVSNQENLIILLDMYCRPQRSSHGFVMLSRNH